METSHSATVGLLAFLAAPGVLENVPCSVFASSSVIARDRTANFQKSCTETDMMV